MRHAIALILALAALPAFAQPTPCSGGIVFDDSNSNGRRDAGEPGLAGVKVSDGAGLVVTDATGRYALPAVGGRTTFVIRPPGRGFAARGNGMPDHWRHGRVEPAHAACDFALRPAPAREVLDVLVFADTQVKSQADVGYYARDIVEPLLAEDVRADLGLTLGDVVAGGNTPLYPALDRATARLGVPWLHLPGNHDMDPDAVRDEDSLRGYRARYGPDSYAWEDAHASFVLLDDVIHRPGATPAYVGGLRGEQFAFLERYLPTLPRERLLVIALHIPLFDAEPGRETFRRADRERLFALLESFPRVLVLSGHSHAQRHVLHDVASGWHGAAPLHEYNVGAASGAYWSGVKDAAGIPDATMSDGTPNGHARLRVAADGSYSLSWHPARLAPGDAFTAAMALHAPKVLRRGAYPAWGVYANVFMGRDDTRVEYRVDGGDWRPMRRVEAPDPRLLAENVRDDEAGALRGYDRSPEATPSPHLWRGALPTGLAAGTHLVEVRAFDPWQGEQRARIAYRLDDAAE